MFKPLEYAYFMVGLVEVYAELTNNSLLRYISKPLLMVILMVYYAGNVQGPVTSFHKIMLAAFFFSWVGDVALMFVHLNENFFLVGLVGFLITHVLYSVAFNKVSSRKAKPILPKRAWVAAPLLIYMVALMLVLVPAIYASPVTRPFLIPVIVYSTAIAVMVVFAINRYKRVNDASFALVFAGALLFMFSDSIIAINKFLIVRQPGMQHDPFALAGLCIMVLYISAQYFIAKGCLKQITVAE